MVSREKERLIANQALFKVETQLYCPATILDLANKALHNHMHQNQENTGFLLFSYH
jgi:hypothetical protein